MFYRRDETKTAKYRPLCCCCVWLMSLLLFGSIARAQVTTGSVLGTITDPSGAIFPNAKIVITSTDTRVAHALASSDSGEYIMTGLPSGSYSITVTAAGFKTAVIANLELEAGGRLRQDVRMAVGENTETVQVSGQTAALEVDTSTLSSVVTDRQVAELPLNGRNFVQLAQLAAGVTEGPPSAISGGFRPDDRRQTAAISAYAQSDTLNNEMVDGLDNNEAITGTIGVRPSVDAIAEFRVHTNMYPAEVGKTPGAVVNLITKSGTNDLHGSAYEFFRNDLFDARNFFAGQGNKPEYRQNQFGASLGGPIRKNKTFFFADYEGMRIVEGTTYVNTVPTLFEEQNLGNFSDIGGPVLSSSQLNSIALKYFQLYPAPNLPGVANNFTYSPNRRQTSDTFDLRGDHYFSDQDRFFARYTLNNVFTYTPGAMPPVNGIEPGGVPNAVANYYPGDAHQRAQQLLLNYTHTFGSNSVMELLAGFTRIRNASLPVNYGNNLGTQFGIVNSNYNALTAGLPTVRLAGYSGFGDTTWLPLIDLDNVFQYSGSLTQTRGHHTFKYGVDLIRRQIMGQQNASGSGLFTFTTNPTPFVLANFLQGNVYTVARAALLTPRYYRTWEPSGYFGDVWRVRPWLTLNLGLRYDIFTPDVDAHGSISTFDPTTVSILVANQNGVSSSAGIETDHRSVAPRFGFAAHVTPNTVVRGGYGIVYFRSNTGPANAFNDPPFVTTYAPNPLTVTFSTPLPLPVPGSTTAPSGALYGMQLDYKNSSMQQFNFNVEHSFGGTVATVGYVGELGRHLRLTPDINVAPPSPVSYVTRRPYYGALPQVTNIWYIQSGGNSSYNGFQATVQRRLSHGITASANYTWSHAIGDVSEFSPATVASSAVPSRTGMLERGNSDLDVRQRFTLMLTYALPFGRQLTGWKGGLAKGWKFGVIDMWETGMPFSVVNSSPRSNTGVNSDRPDQLGTATLSNPSIQKWFDTSMFQPQALGTVGTESRNALYGPHFRHFDCSLAKEFRIQERYTLEARIESFNLTNTPNFSAPAGTLGAVGFGSINSTRVGSTPRELQFALRLSF
jgi:hypothetical protein